MPRIETHHLQALAERPAGKAYIGELIRRLVYATTAKQQPGLHFLAGESNGYAGWDGWVEVSYEESGSVRRHRSLWELSTDRNFESKFKRDFVSAKTKTLPHGWSKSDVVYVGVTLRGVTPAALSSIKAKFSRPERDKWAGVVLLAADDLVQWIEKQPSVEDWAAEEFQIGSGRFGRALEHWYSAWSNQTTPPVSEQLLTAGRDISAVTSAFRAEGEAISTLLCDSTHEAVALIYCAIRTLSEADARLVMSSTLVVESEVSADRLAAQPVSLYAMPTVILAPPATKHRNRLVQAGYRVFQVLGRPDDSLNVIRFERASVQDFAAALEASMSSSAVDAEVSARSVGSSVSIWHIRNLFLNSQQPALPAWADGQQTDAVVAAVFAGAWREDSQRDMEVVSALAGMDEERLASALLQYANCTTPLLETIGTSRFVIAPTAAFEFIQRGITRYHIARLSNAVSLVFSGISTAVDERWRGAPAQIRSRNPRDDLSKGLRDGLAETLLRIAVLGAPLVQSGALIGFASTQGYVDHLIRKFDGLSSDPRVLASLDRQLPVLIEAAPGPFLDALDALIQGDPNGLGLMLADESGIFGRSFHTGLLWGLEALAWSAELLPRVAHLLASLDRIDIGGHISNRPFRSLCEIFLPWHPGTTCDPRTRTEILRGMLEREPEVGWKLLVALLPGKRTTSMMTQRPRWRSYGQLDRKSIKRSEVVEAYELTVSLTLEIAGFDPVKLADLVDQYPHLSSQHKATLEQALRSASRSTAAPEELQRLWSRVDKLCRHHASFSEADWALPASDLERIRTIADGFVLNDPVLTHRWLFDEQVPDLGSHGDDYDERARELQRRRRTAIAEVLSSQGWEGVHRLVSTVVYRYIVGNELGQLERDDGELLEAMNRWQAQDPPEWMAFRSISCSRAGVRGPTWTGRLLKFAEEQDWSSTSIAMALVDYPDVVQTYDTVRDLPEDVRKEYWTRRFGYLWGAKEDLNAFRTAVQEFLRYGRAADLIDQNWNDLPKLGAELVLSIVDAFIAQPLNAEKVKSLGSISHDLQRVFEWLRKQAGVDVESIARREYALLPLLTNHGIERGDLALHELLRRQPEFFADVVCDLYKPASAERDLPDTDVETARARAHVAFELLDSWRTPPGVEDGGVSVEILGGWVDAVRAQLVARDRAEIGDQTIGKLLYHLPPDQHDAASPPQALRVLLERWRSEQLERGFEIESFNSRGVYSRSIDEGGRQERELAARWRRHAEVIGTRWPRARALCLRIAESWTRHAEAEDLDAQRDRARRSR